MEEMFYHRSAQVVPLIVPYQAELVFLSVSIAVLSGFAGLSVIARIHAAQKANSPMSWLWLGGGAINGGGGFWAMHFIGLLALRFPLAVAYDLNLTLWSVLPAIFGTGTILFVFSRPRRKKSILLLGGILLGCFFGLTHLIGMAALEGVDRQVVMLFDPNTIALAGLIAVVAPVLAVFLADWIVPNPGVPPGFIVKLKWSLNAGMGPAAMHYTMVHATVFVAGDVLAGSTAHPIDPRVLALWIALTSITIAALTILMSIVDSRLQQAAQDAALSRSRMHEAINSIDDAFCLYDTEDRLVECNQRYRELLDGGEGVLPGMAFETVMRSAAEAGLILDAAGRIENWVTERLASHRAARKPDIVQFRNAGWIQFNERRVWNVGTVTICTDVTAMKQEQALREQMLETEAAMERQHSMARMVAGVAHEINTPIGIANTAVSIIENRLTGAKTAICLDDEAGQDLLEATALLKNSILRAHRLVATFKKISVGQASDNPEILDLPDLLQDCIDLFKINARRAKLNIEMDISALRGTRAWFGYSGSFTQVLLNLLENIERYAYPGGEGGPVSIEVTDQDDQFIMHIRDAGKGIAATDLPQIFEPFFTTGRDQGGTGLGLAIVHNIVTTLFKGQITAVSTPGNGCCFVLNFPKNGSAVDGGEPIRAPAASVP